MLVAGPALQPEPANSVWIALLICRSTSLLEARSAACLLRWREKRDFFRWCLRFEEGRETNALERGDGSVDFVHHLLLGKGDLRFWGQEREGETEGSSVQPGSEAI